MRKNISQEVAVRVENLNKKFRIPHEKNASLKGAVLSLFKKKTFEEFRALDNVSFEVRRGEFLGIVGRNGSGKSTLLKMLAGIYVPDSGRITVNGKISPFLELGVGFNQELSGRENLYLGGAILGLTRKEVDEKFDKIVEFAELEDFIDMKLKNYSSGMQVRLAFALSINVQAEILLMDEVLAVGDTNFQAKCIEEFNKYRLLGKTVILVTHDINVVQRYCDRALILRSGKLEFLGTAKEAADYYSSQNIKDYRQNGLHYNGKIIKSIKMLRKGKKTGSVYTGEEFDLRVSYRIPKSLKKPIFGVVIDDDSGHRVFTTNTLIKKPVRVGPGRRDNLIEVSFVIKNLLSDGVYFMSPAVSTENGNIIEWATNMMTLKVINQEYKVNGVADFEHRIYMR